jgi:sarcosine oxidase
VFGAWTAYQLRLSGKSVALLDAYGPGNSRSSSGGESRVIRMSYGADELYTRWSSRSLALWKQLFEQTQETGLFHPTGVLWTAPEGDPRFATNQAALRNSGVSFETLSHEQVSVRYPQIRFGWPISAVFEPESGVLLARRCVQAVVREAVRQGVEYFNIPYTNAGELPSAGQVIYACGSWLPKLFPDAIGRLIQSTRQEVFFFGIAAGDKRFAPPQMPVWLDYSDPRGGYCLPDIESRGFKLAFDRHGPEVDPDTQERVVSSASVEAAREFVRERFPDLAAAPILETRVCQYENTSTGDFLIDRHPDVGNAWFVGGGSGHGFKHGPAVGEYVAKLMDGSIAPESRFALSCKAEARQRSVF